MLLSGGPELSDTGRTAAAAASRTKGDPMPDSDESVRHEESSGRGRFSLSAGGDEAEMTYSLRGAVMVIAHTFTPPSMRGHGVASRLMRAAADHARAKGLKISPMCSYAAAWMQRHDGEQDLLEA